MAFYRVVADFPSVTGLPEDVCVNTWHFSITNPSQVDFDEIADALRDFYTGGAAGNSVQNLLSDLIVGNQCELTMYALADPVPRVPVASYSNTLAIPAATSLPREVALCLSYQALAISGIPQARRRGRIFLGPLNATAGEEANGDFRPTAQARGIVADAATRLQSASDLAGNWSWVVFSDVLGITQSPQFVEDGWVDDSFDTQRRRGRATTTRTIWP